MKFFFYFLVLVPTLVFGQINESDTLNLKAKIALTGFFQGGNVQTFIFRAKTDVSVVPWKKWVFKTQNSYVYQAFGGDKADEDFLSLNFLYLNPHKKIYPLVLGFVSTNFRREINVRYLFGAGFTYQVLNTEKGWLKLSLTTEYERTSFNKTNFNLVAYNGQDLINTLRGTLWINGKYHLFKKKVILTHESYLQPSLQESNNYRWRADIGLEFPVWKYLNFNINYLHTFESLIIENQKQQDKFLTFGFTLKSF
ncbi:MAG: DUF481 domain-containing protein [Polaribacter sp.]